MTFILKASILACVDPASWSFTEDFSHVATKPTMYGLCCHAYIFGFTLGACYYVDNISCLAANSVSNLKVVIYVWFDIKGSTCQAVIVTFLD